MTTAAVPQHAQGIRPQDRRHHPRVQSRGVASHLRTAEAMASGLAVENISMGGLFVRCATAFQVGMPVTVQLVRPGLKRAIRMTGRVVSVVSPAEARARGSVPGMGIGLDSIEQDTAERLRDLVDGLVAARPREPRRG